MDKFVVRSNPPIKVEGMIKTHCMSDAVVGAVVDVNSMCAVFAELRPTAPEEMCLLHEREISGVPVTALRVIAKTEEGFIGTLIDHFERSIGDTQTLVPHYNEKGFEELELNSRGEKIAKEHLHDVSEEQSENMLWVTEDVSTDIVNGVCDVLEKRKLSDTKSRNFISVVHFDNALIIDDDMVTEKSAVSKNKRRVFRNEFATMCDDVFGRKAIDRNLASFAGIIMSSGLYLVE